MAVAAARWAQTVISRDGGGGDQRGHQQAGQQERRDHLPHDRQLGPCCVCAELGVDGASVMDEHVDPVMGGAEVAGEGADRIEVLQIGQAVTDADAAGRRGDAAPGPLSPGRGPR